MEQTLKSEMLTRWRDMLARDRETLRIWRDGSFRFSVNGEDVTKTHLVDFEDRIARMERLIATVESADA